MEKIRMRQKRLNQFLDLINADLLKMTDVDKYSLGARFNFSTPMSLFGKRQSAEAHWKAVIASVPRVQLLFKHLIEKMIGLKEGGQLPLPSVRRNLTIKSGCFNIISEPISPQTGGGFKQLVVSGIDDPFEEMLLSDIGELAVLLDGVPQTAFRTCQNPKCGKMFLQISNKPKLYCSSSCAFKFLSKERRDRMRKKAK